MGCATFQIRKISKVTSQVIKQDGVRSANRSGMISCPNQSTTSYTTQSPHLTLPRTVFCFSRLANSTDQTLHGFAWTWTKADFSVFNITLYLDVKKYQWHTEGGDYPPPKFQRPSKMVPNSTLLWKLLKIAEFWTSTPQDVRKKGSKILKLPRFAIVLH